MDFLSTIQALLDPLAPGGAYYGEVPSVPTQPWITWQRIVSGAVATLEGASTTQGTHTQIDIHAPRIGDAEAIRKAVDAALDALGGCIPLTSTDTWEPVVKHWRITSEYSIWFTES